MLVILLYCRHGTEVLSTVPKCKKAVDVPFGEICVSDKLYLRFDKGFNFD